MDNIFLIKDLARNSGQSIHTIRYYLKIGLIKEEGRSPETRFRYFNHTTLKKLEKIRQLRRQKKSLREIQEIFK